MQQRKIKRNAKSAEVYLAALNQMANPRNKLSISKLIFKFEIATRTSTYLKERGLIVVDRGKPVRWLGAEPPSMDLAREIRNTVNTAAYRDHCEKLRNGISDNDDVTEGVNGAVLWPSSATEFASSNGETLQLEFPEDPEEVKGEEVKPVPMRHFIDALVSNLDEDGDALKPIPADLIIYIVKAALRALKARGWKVIFNISEEV